MCSLNKLKFFDNHAKFLNNVFPFFIGGERGGVLDAACVAAFHKLPK